MATAEHSGVSGFVDNWQGGKTLAECNLRMLNTQDSCDVTFRCGSEGRVIRAHRYVLIRSCVFHAMFSGPLAEESDIMVPEIEHQFFQTFILYLYTDNTTIDSDNATALLYAARKYAVTGLENKCRDFLKTNLTVDNACVILEAALRFDQKELFDMAFILIKKEGGRSLTSPGFLTLSQELVDQIVESDDLEADEHVIFTAVNNWAEVDCKRKGKEITPENKRSVLGNTLMMVRFPLMKQSFLVTEVKVSGLLTDTERLLIMDHLVSPGIDVKPFSIKKRSYRKITKTQHRFRSVHFSPKSYPSPQQGDVQQLPHHKMRTGFVYDPSDMHSSRLHHYQERHQQAADAISFQSNRCLSLIGYHLYGTFNKRLRYSVEMKMMSCIQGPTLIKKVPSRIRRLNTRIPM